MKRLEPILAHRSAPWVIAAVGLLLLTPSIDDALVLDDHILMLQQRDPPPIEGLAHRPWDLFTFTTGEPEDNRRMIDHGVLLPWWSHPELRVAFLRPLSSLTHRLDGWLWPDRPARMHVHSLLWFALLLGVVGSLYRRWLEPGWVAALGFLLFAVDDAHGATVSWIANRNAVVSLALAMPALHLHARHRRTGSAMPLAGAVVLFAAALLAGEMALSVLGYLAAHALWLDRGRAGRRLGALVPYAAVVVGWRVAYHQLGYGAFGSGGYHDPGHEPLAFAAALARNLPLLLGAQVGLPLADHGFWGPPALRPVLIGVALVTAAGVLALSVRLLRQEPTARFWATGMVLAAVPVAASVPGERLLLGVGVGGSAFMALLLVALAQQVRERIARHRLARAGLIGLVGVHLVLAPALLPLRARSMAILGGALREADRSLPSDSGVEDATVVIVQAPVDVFASYIQVRRAQEATPRPAHLSWLATASSPLTITRAAPRVLRLAPDAGFLYAPPEQHYRSPTAAFHPGQRIPMPGFSAVVRRVTPDGRPRTVDFRFDDPLDAPDLLLRVWDDGAYVPFDPPPVGASIRLPARDLFGTLQAHVHP
ncbi:MAG: hypothetical protein ACOCV4_01065 [Myxococcota bacterium]